VAIGAAEGAALRDEVVARGATRTLEIGLGYAIATMFICDGLLQNGPGGRHIVIDPFQHEGMAGESTLFGGAGVRALQRAGIRQLVELYEEGSEVVLPRLLANGRRFDFAFIDGSHRFENVFCDLVFCGRLLAEGDVVFVDDIHHPPIAHAVGYCTSNLGWELASVEHEDDDHWAVLRNGPAELLTRRFTEFTPW
jgi:predicted O-methyltransferase YrrM